MTSKKEQGKHEETKFIYREPNTSDEQKILGMKNLWNKRNNFF
jgi:hypothetical protein